MLLENTTSSQKVFQKISPVRISGTFQENFIVGIHGFRDTVPLAICSEISKIRMNLWMTYNCNVIARGSWKWVQGKCALHRWLQQDYQRRAVVVDDSSKFKSI